MVYYDDCGCRRVRYERVLLEPGHYEDRTREVVSPAGWDLIERQELVTPGRWETLERREPAASGFGAGVFVR